MMADGWTVRVTTLDQTNGRPVLYRHYFVFESDRDYAVVLVKMHMSVNQGETIEVLEPVALHVFLSQGMKPRDVKLHA
jgi:hypothetical protein